MLLMNGQINSVGGLRLAYGNPSQAQRLSHEARESPRLLPKLKVLAKGDSVNFG